MSSARERFRLTTWRVCFARNHYFDYPQIIDGCRIKEQRFLIWRCNEMICFRDTSLIELEPET